MNLTDDLLYKIGTAVVSAMITLIGTVVGLTRFIGNKYASDILKLEQMQEAYQTKTDNKITQLEESERKCLEDKAILTGRVATLEKLAKIEGDK